MNILIVSPDYPTERRTKYQFVKELVSAFVAHGHDCFVLSPYSVTKNRSFCPYMTSSEGVSMCRPNYLSFSTLKVAGFSPTYALRKRALYKALRGMDFRPDVVYAHFWEAAEWVYDYARANHLPLFVASGESVISNLFDLSRLTKDFADYVSGVICVSRKNMEESVSLGLTSAEKCVVLPNATDRSLFRKMDKAQCRSELGVPQNAYVVAFVGAFCERKGVRRLSAAIDRIKALPVHSFFIGNGEEMPSCGNILFVGPLPHERIPVYLNAADVFVLPTLHEGCCNAVVEALACGLPVISSDLPFNWDVLNKDNSIMVDPTDVEAIAEAIVALSDAEKRRLYADHALASVDDVSIEKRAEDILRFIQSRMSV